MRDLPAELVLQKNVWSDGDPWILLVILELNDASSTVLRYAANTQDVEYLGVTYSANNMRPSEVISSQEGVLTDVTLTITNVGRALVDYFADPDDIIGSDLTMLFVHNANLTVDSSALEVSFKVKTFRVDSMDVELGLGDETLTIRRHPPRLYSTLQCEWAPQNFKGAECQYVGVDTTCDGLLASCRNRTGGSNVEHFGGFPTLHNDGLKVAVG
jgi:phage-related protein